MEMSAVLGFGFCWVRMCSFSFLLIIESRAVVWFHVCGSRDLVWVAVRALGFWEGFVCARGPSFRLLLPPSPICGLFFPVFWSSFSPVVALDFPLPLFFFIFHFSFLFFLFSSLPPLRYYPPLHFFSIQ